MSALFPSLGHTHFGSRVHQVVDSILYLVEEPLFPPVGASWHPLLGKDGIIIPIVRMDSEVQGQARLPLCAAPLLCVLP